MIMESLKNKKVFLSGVTSGLGESLLEKLIKMNCEVY